MTSEDMFDSRACIQVWRRLWAQDTMERGSSDRPLWAHSGRFCSLAIREFDSCTTQAFVPMYAATPSALFPVAMKRGATR